MQGVLKNAFTLQRTFFRCLSEAIYKALYLTSFFSRFFTPFWAAFAKQQFPVDGFLRDSVKIWFYRLHLTHRGKRFCKVGRKFFSNFLLLTTTPKMAELPNGARGKFAALAVQQGLGKALPNKFTTREKLSSRRNLAPW